MMNEALFFVYALGLIVFNSSPTPPFYVKDTVLYYDTLLRKKCATPLPFPISYPHMESFEVRRWCWRLLTCSSLFRILMLRDIYPQTSTQAGIDTYENVRPCALFFWNMEAPFSAPQPIRTRPFSVWVIPYLDSAIHQRSSVSPSLKLPVDASGARSFPIRGSWLVGFRGFH